MTITPAHAAGDLDASLWNRRCPIVLQSSEVSGTGNLTNFPVVLTEDCFPSEMFDADGSYPALDGGADLRFSSDINGATELCFEVVDCSTDNDPANGTAEVWVKIPTLDYDDDTTIYVWYNNASASAYATSDTYGAESVWNSDFRAVLHLNESGNGTADEYLDSTTNDKDATGGNGNGTKTPTQVSGKIGNAQDFDGGDDYILTKVYSNNLGEPTTFSFWIDPEADGRHTIVSAYVGGSNQRWDAEYDRIGNQQISWLEHDSATYENSDDAIGAGWTHVSVIHYNGGDELDFYLNGAFSGGADIARTLGTSQYVSLGSRPDGSAGGDTFNGLVDEVHVSDTNLSGPWIATEYANQNSPSTFAVEGSPADPSPSLDSSLWGRKCPIVIQSSEVSGTGNLTNFPVLLTEDTLPAEMFGGANAAKDGGGDIRFSSDSAGTTELCFEIVDFDTTDDEAEVWVKIPTLSGTSDTTFYVWYDYTNANGYAIDDTYGAENVWTNGYVMVHHFEESDIDGGAGDIVDSTTNDNDGTTSGMDGNDDVPAKIGNGFDFDGNNDCVTVSSSASLNTNHLTIFAWVKWSGDATYYGEINGKWGAVDFQWTLLSNIDSGKLRFWTAVSNNNEVILSTNALPDGEWAHVAATYDGDTQIIYINGVPEGENAAQSGNLDTSAQALQMGYRNDLSTYPFNGTIDEERICNTARSGPWIATEYNNQNGPGSFAVEGTAEDGDAEEEASNVPPLTIHAGEGFTIRSGTRVNIRS